ncbi:MAG: hypothetical protein COB67_04700, partial [SAR324 cluster bacterium]
MLGNEAIAWGLMHANVDVVSGYPGTPSSEILKNFQEFSRIFIISYRFSEILMDFQEFLNI